MWQRLAVVSRLLLAAAFLPSGLTKVLGNRFTSISPDTPIGYFFEALYQSGFYYRFIGLAQVTAALLLLIPRTTALGAVVYFPIILNIFIITVSLHFTGTPYITGLMLLASIFLLCWEYDRFRDLRLFARPATTPKRVFGWEPLLWGAAAAAVFGLAYMTRFSVIESVGAIGAVVFTAAGFLGGLLMRWHLNGMRSA
ncbi:MAG: DoxX family membrane protein [Rhodothermales bacterium]